MHCTSNFFSFSAPVSWIQLCRRADEKIGLKIEDGVIRGFEENSSARDNGVPLDRHIVEINGVNVVGLNDEKLEQIFAAITGAFTLTLLRHKDYDKLVSG
ncbi:unnamed protein product [Dibothriocephalus latus]|uniref:PDZ domain-containing protein n=1 Tax=Dibothriocephalus latus TaxID=60516 RepID=A0A3P6QMI2_DIBLA|nr:unnamed protein product [Dibothriocephalus latus]